VIFLWRDMNIKHTMKVDSRSFRLAILIKRYKALTLINFHTDMKWLQILIMILTHYISMLFRLNGIQTLIRRLCQLICLKPLINKKSKSFPVEERLATQKHLWMGTPLRLPQKTDWRQARASQSVLSYRKIIFLENWAMHGYITFFTAY